MINWIRTQEPAVITAFAAGALLVGTAVITTFWDIVRRWRIRRLRRN